MSVSRFLQGISSFKGFQEGVKNVSKVFLESLKSVLNTRKTVLYGKTDLYCLIALITV